MVTQILAGIGWSFLAMLAVLLFLIGIGAVRITVTRSDGE